MPPSPVGFDGDELVRVGEVDAHDLAVGETNRVLSHRLGEGTSLGPRNEAVLAHGEAVQGEIGGNHAS